MLSLCLTLCDPMDCSMLGLPACHHFPEFSQVHVHWISDAFNHLFFFLHIIQGKQLIYINNNSIKKTLQWENKNDVGVYKQIYHDCGFGISVTHSFPNWQLNLIKF